MNFLSHRNPAGPERASSFTPGVWWSSLALALRVLLGIGPSAAGATLDPGTVALLKRSFVEGREYFVLRSGRAKLIAQADRIDVGPAFLYLVFDAQDNQQTARKERAFNFGTGHGFISSGLEVVLGGYAFSALGHQTRTRWVLCEEIPAVEAVWWAGGLQVTERLLALGDAGLFLRRVELASANLGGPETVRLRLSLPPGACAVRDGWLVQEGARCRLALGSAGGGPARAVPERGRIEVGPLTLSLGETATVDTLLRVQIPAQGDGQRLASIESPLPLGRAEVIVTGGAVAPGVWVEAVGAQQTVLGWGRPAKPCDAAFRHIIVAYGDAIRYRLRGAGDAPVSLAFGWCESHHREPGQRVLAVEIEGKLRHTIDPVAAGGADVPVVVLSDARDEDGDGVVEVTIAAAEAARDKNPILNGLWVFGGEPPVAERIQDGSNNTNAVAFVHALAPESEPPGVELPVLGLGLGQAAAQQSPGRGDHLGEPLLEETRGRWRHSSVVRTADGTVQDIFDKARFGLPAMVADNGVMDAGMFEYGAQWVRDTSNTLLGLVHAGHFELARRGFSHVLEHMVNPEGNAMIGGGFDDPDREQFDQMGELVHALKAYRDWTGDDSLLRKHRAKLLAMIERPMRPEFRDSTGMVHNRREFWERTFEDAYELAYQTYVVLGWREAAALAAPLGAAERADRWRAEADRTWAAVLSHPTDSLVQDGRFIKRRSVDGEHVRTIRFPAAAGDVPLKTEAINLAEPDATMALPVAYRLVDPRSDLARNTLDELERLWNGRWFGGGYERYHSSGQCDQPGPWSFASCFILRAQHAAGLWDRSRRTLEWLDTVQGGRTGAWFEEIPLVRSQAPTAGILPWTSGEISLFIVRHLLGVRFEGDVLVLAPALYPNSPPVRADLRFRQGRLIIDLPGAGPVEYAEVDGQRREPDPDGAIRLPAGFAGGVVVFHDR